MKRSDKNQLAEHFFRHSYAKTVAILVRYFGLEQVEIAEDIVQDTLTEAMEKWSINSIPDNPEGWIMDVAKKKTINLLKRKQLFLNKIAPDLDKPAIYDDAIAADSTLRMIFACCHPSLPNESQIALALKTLCGLSLSEIARSLLTKKDNINKRLYRAKKKLRENKVEFSLPIDTEQGDRLEIVYKTLYVLFNEGYYAPHHKDILRIDLCYEAVRLVKEVLKAFPESSRGNGLLSLMLFSLARFESRLSEGDSLVCLQDQDRERWDQKLITQGMHYLTLSTKGNKVNTYQIQAGIAAEYCLAPTFEATNWQSIYNQYCLLESFDNSFIVKMNKAIAGFYAEQESESITSLLNLGNLPDFQESTSYYLTLGTLCLHQKEKEKTSYFLKKALTLSENEKERIIIQSRLLSLDSI